MKKSLVVLLIVVLAVGSAFAAVTGSASFSAGYDLGKNTLTFNSAKNGSGTFEFEFAADTGATAESDKIAAKFSGKYTATMSQDGLKSGFEANDLIIYKTDDLWSLNLTKVPNGIEFEYDGYTLDAAYEKKGNWSVSAKTKTYELAEGLTVGFGVGYKSALNDITDPATWTYGYKADVQKAHDKAYKEFFAMCDDGVHYANTKNAKIVAINEKIDAVADAEKALKKAKEAFADKQTKANFDAIEKAEKAVTKAETNLAKAIAKAEDAFKEAHVAEDKGAWYTETETKGYQNETWAVTENKKLVAATLKDNEVMVFSGILLDNTTGTEDKTYYVYLTDVIDIEDINSTAGTGTGKKTYAAIEKELYTADMGDVVYVATVKKGEEVYAYSYRAVTTTTTYSPNEEKYAFLPTKGTQTLFGSLNVAYTAENFLVKADLNAAYEFIAEELSYDATLSGNYKFVTAKVAYDSDKVLDAEASAELDDIVGLPLSIKVVASDILSEGDDGFVLSGEAEATIDAFTVGAKGSFDFDGRKDKEKSKWEGSINASYKMDVATFKAAATLYRERTISDGAYNFDGEDLVVKPSVSVSTTSVIDNATLTLDWSGAKFNGADASNGAVTAKIEVKF